MSGGTPFIKAGGGTPFEQNIRQRMGVRELPSEMAEWIDSILIRQQLLEQELARQVQHARALGCSWATIGKALHLERHTAYRRYRHLEK